MVLPKIDIRLMAEADLEHVRQLRNANRHAYFMTDEVSAEQQRKWWEHRDQSVLYFVGSVECICSDNNRAICDLCRGHGRRHVWQFSLSQDGVLGNLAVADWIKGQGVAKHCVARVLVSGQRYWGLFRTDNPAILRFWPSLGFPEPTDEPPGGRDRGGHPPGTVRWVDHVWTEADALRQGVEPWYVEQAERLSAEWGYCRAAAVGTVDRLVNPSWEAKAAAWLVLLAVFDRRERLNELERLGIPHVVAQAVRELVAQPDEDRTDRLLRVKRRNRLAAEVLTAWHEDRCNDQDSRPEWREYHKLAWWALKQEVLHR